MTSRHLNKFLCGVGTFALLSLAHGVACADDDVPFAISVDGARVDSSHPDFAVSTAKEADIQVKFDGLGVHPILNVSSFPMRVSFKPGENIRFLASFNYGAWVTHGEIRIVDRSTKRPIAVVPISKLGAAEWQMPSDAPNAMEYVLRVYDADGRYDETRPLPLEKTNSSLPISSAASNAAAPGYSEDRTAFRNISVFGGSVTVYGKNIPEGHEVMVAGEPVPVDGSNGFVVQRIFPPGKHSIDISVKQGGEGLDFTRDIEVPETEWFYVALADFTAGHDFKKGIVQSTDSDEFDGIWTRGRLAYYLKGKIKGQYILTAAADTGEGSLRNMFKGLNGKDPQSAIKRIDPNAYYPIYGDDSTVVDDAPTNGKFYLRLEKGPSSFMWGNFRTNITGSHFMQSARALYGANGVYRSQAVTKDGEAKLAADVYAAQPSTVPGHDIFRGTGGSAYFLKHQDLNIAGETILLERRNPITGWVVERKTLAYRTDYDINYVLGIVTLRDPLPSTTSNGNENFLVVHYEYTPVVTDTNGYITGGRAQAWIGDHIRFGVSGKTEKTQSADQRIYGADVRVQKTKDTFIEAEIARSDGPGFSSNYSADGGLSLQTNSSVGAVGKQANAYRLEGQAALEDLTDGNLRGHVGALFERFDEGYSSLDVEAAKTKQTWGADADVELSEKAKVKAAYSESDIANGEHNRQADGKMNVAIDDHWSVEPYGRFTQKSGSTSTTDQQGARGDLGSKLIYTWDSDRQAYVFGQGTISRTGTMYKDNRAGIGGKTKLTDKVSASGEISEGNQGIDALAGLSYEPTADDRYYLGYRLDAMRDISSSIPYTLQGDDLGTIIVGARKNFGDEWSTHAEDNYDMFGLRQALTQTYGVTYTPTKNWVLDGSVEVGRVYDNTIDPTTLLKNKDIDRQAASLSASYRNDDGLDGRVKGEARWDSTEGGTSDVMTYLFQANFGAKVSKDWRALGKLDVNLTDATESTRDTRYVDGTFGFAYRPAASDRFNALLKYNYVYDAPGGDQVGVDGTTSSPLQQSNIFSVDASYDITQSLTLGGKYGFRIGKTKDRAVGSNWENSSAHLGILRADLHIVKQWDALVEGRVLWSPDQQTTDYGALAAIYRQINDNFKVGVGYNFGDFTDNLSDLSHNDHGVFLNVIGKF